MTPWRERPLGMCRYVYFDARYEKRQEKGYILDMAVLTAIGVNEEGKREVLGISISISASEAEVRWRDFFSSLIKRGLQWVELIISDAHEGQKAARKKFFLE
jgi:putative transposase